LASLCTNSRIVVSDRIDGYSAAMAEPGSDVNLRSLVRTRSHTDYITGTVVIKCKMRALFAEHDEHGSSKSRSRIARSRFYTTCPFANAEGGIALPATALRAPPCGKDSRPLPVSIAVRMAVDKAQTWRLAEGTQQEEDTGPLGRLYCFIKTISGVCSSRHERTTHGPCLRPVELNNFP
jgi:hypothetical protein